ncbi:MAG: ATP-binding protein [Zetaproteobacteria bacterium]|nr:MAG: ATP-binding protein [Zetaproteobacteria bacterium]
MYRRPMFQTLLSRLKERRRFLQVLSGPRQTGKTTLVQQVLTACGLPGHYASADAPSLQGRAWIEQQWDVARLIARDRMAGVVLVLDEIQKVPDWSEAVKRCWDADTASRCPLRVVLLGSAPLLVQRGLTESLAGRFELIPVPHWSYSEMQAAFGWTLDQYIFFGGYPGAAELIDDPPRWRRYVLEALIETTVSRDVLLMTRVDKPALLRRLFDLGCVYSGQVLSYQKMLGQLQEAGNTTTLAHYLELLAGAGMLTGLAKFSGAQVRQRASSPKLQALNTALITAQSAVPYAKARRTPAVWGRLVESAVGAHLLNSGAGTPAEVCYWRERGREVDFVLRSGKRLAAIEVKSGASKGSFPGMEAFMRAFHPQRTLVVGGDGLPLDEFFRTPAAELVAG